MVGSPDPSRPLPRLAPVTTAAVGGRSVALTFDDGPNGPDTADLLDVLAALGVRATFCLVGMNVEGRGAARLVRRMLREGHGLANHAMTYADLGEWPHDRVSASLRATDAAIRGALGPGAAPVRWFRAPNGSWGVSAAVAVGMGMTPLGVVNTIEDWLTQDVDVLSARLRSAVRPGQVLVAHDGGGDRAGTVAAVARVLPELLADGWTFAEPGRRHGLG